MLCEIKYTKAPFKISKDYAKELMRKESVFRKQTKTKKQIYFVLISANGLENTIYAEELVTHTVNLSNLFA
jgi:hypothetical protein